VKSERVRSRMTRYRYPMWVLQRVREYARTVLTAIG
jgi:hypothetical protein